MIQADRSRWALKVIHDLIIKARSLAYEGKDSAYIAEFLGEVEYLPVLMLVESDRTELFRDYVIAICNRFECREVLNRNPYGIDPPYF